MDNLIDLNVYGTTCHMRLFADKMIAMQSDADYRKLVTILAKHVNPFYVPEDHLKLARLKRALNERKHFTDRLTLRSMKKADITRCQRQIVRRMQITDEVMKKNGLFEIWEKIV